MSNKINIKLLKSIRIVIGIICFTILGWVYSMGIVTPQFEAPFDYLYRGLGGGMVYPLFFIFIPMYIKSVFPNSRYLGNIVATIVSIFTVILLFATYPYA